MKRTSKHTDVEEALDLLSTEVREEIQRIRNEGAQAMTKGDYETAKSVIDFAGNLETFAGKFSGLHLLCIEYVGFQLIDPSIDLGFDLSAEYAEALRMHKKG